MASRVYLGLGSNLGKRQKNLEDALEDLGRLVTIDRVSSVYETEPVGFPNQPWFLNMVLSGTTELDPFELLALAKDTEMRHGRVAGFPNGPRPLDIDVLFYEDRVFETDSLVVPHPRIEERAFVLIPLVEIAPYLVHPKLGKTIKEILSKLGDSKQVRKWGNVSSIGSRAL